MKYYCVYYRPNEWNPVIFASVISNTGSAFFLHGIIELNFIMFIWARWKHIDIIVQWPLNKIE